MSLERVIRERGVLIDVEEQHTFLHGTEDQVLHRSFVPQRGLTALELLRGVVGAPLGETGGRLRAPGSEGCADPARDHHRGDDDDRDRLHAVGSVRSAFTGLPRVPQAFTEWSSGGRVAESLASGVPSSSGPDVHLPFISGQSCVHTAFLASRSTRHPEEGRSMRKLRMHAGVLAGLLALSLVAAACGGDDTPSGGGDTDTGSAPPDLTGSITISGSSTVEPISSIVAEIFNETSPNVSISVDGPGTGDGFELFCSGETDISDASRPIEDDEAKACKKAGIEYTELEVGLDGVTVMTNPENADVTCLNFGDLYALFGPESEGIDTWNGADSLAAEVGGNGGFPDAPLEITAPGEESGTYDAFIELSGIEDTAIAQGVPEDEAAALRSDYQRSPNDNVIIAAMEGSPSALGFVGFAFAEQAGDQVKEVQVDGGSGCVDPSADTISDGSYPLSRSLYIYVSSEAMARPEVKAYVDFYLTDESLATAGLLEEVGYIPLPPERIETTRSAWETASA